MTTQIESKYLQYLCQLYAAQRAGTNTDSKLARISNDDYVRIQAILKLTNEHKEITREDYEEGVTRESGLPVWIKGSVFYNSLSPGKNKKLRKERDPLKTTVRILDTFKRFTDLTEDILSTIRTAGLLEKILEPIVRGLIGGFNLLNTGFEFFKSIYDFCVAWVSDSEFRTAHLAAAGLRAGLASTGIILCSIYLASIIALPFALIGISATLLPIFMITLTKNAYLYVKAKQKKEESEEKNEHSLNKFEQECLLLEKKVNELALEKPYLLEPEEIYRLATLRHRLENDNNDFLDAERAMSFSAMEMLLYLFIALGSILTLVMFLNPATAPVASIIALTATLIGVVGTLAIKIFQWVDDHYKNKYTRTIRLFIAEIELPQSTFTQLIKEFAANIPGISLESILNSKKTGLAQSSSGTNHQTSGTGIPTNHTVMFPQNTNLIPHKNSDPTHLKNGNNQ